MRGWPLVLALSTACTPQDPAVLSLTPSPIAVGASAHGSMNGLDSASIEPPDIFSLVVEGDQLELVALAEGTARLIVVADHTEMRTLTALPITGVGVAPLVHGQPCSAPPQFMAGGNISLPVELRNGADLLRGDVLPPITATGATIMTDVSADGTLDLRLTDTPTTVTLTSPVDPTFSFELVSFGPSQIEALAFGEPTPPTVLGLVTLQLDLIVGGRPVCGDALQHTISAGPETVCQLHAVDPDIVVRRVHDGACTVTAELGGTGVTASKTFAITM